MGRTLKSPVLHGAVYYDAGTDEADIRDACSITADVWEGEPSASFPVSNVDPEEFAKAAKALEDAHATIEQLKARVAELEAGPADVEKGAYDGLDVDALKAEIDKRNDGREQDQRIDKRGGVEKLVAALEVDDKAQEG